jgi:hypothetical protein
MTARDYAATDWRREWDLEADLSAAVAAYLEHRGDVLLTRVEAGGTSRKRQTLKGTADWCGVVLGGQHIELEMKSRTGTSRPAQLQRCTAVRRMGGRYEVCRSVQAVHEAIEKARKG